MSAQDPKSVAVVVRLANLALLGLYPLVWTAPLLSTEILYLFATSPVSVISGVADLYETDLFLCIVVVMFAIVMPYGKTLLLTFVHFAEIDRARKLIPAVEVMGRLSMTDVFLIAIYVVVFKGVGLGAVNIEWGLYAFTGLVLCSIFIGWATHRSLEQMSKEAAG